MTPFPKFLATAVCLAASAGMAAAAHAQSYPTRGISVVVPYGPGGQTDISARIFAKALTPIIGQTVTIVNRSGAGGSVGIAEVAKFEPDGYRLGIITSTPMVRLPHLNNLPYTLDDFTYICRISNNPLMFAVKKDSRLSTPADLIEAARSGTVRYGSSGRGSTQHMAMTLLTDMSNTKMTHVPASNDTDNLRNILANVITGSLVPASVINKNRDTIKPIGVMDTHRNPGFKDVQTFKEAGYDVTFSVWGGLAGPKALPKPVVDKLRSTCKQAQETKAFAADMRKLGMEPAYLDAAEFKATVRKEYEVSGRLLRSIGLKK